MAANVIVEVPVGRTEKIGIPSDRLQDAVICLLDLLLERVRICLDQIGMVFRMASDLTAQPHGTLHHSTGFVVDVLSHHKKAGVCLISFQRVQNAVGILPRTVVKGQCHHRL